jgi:hypothetical protein
MSDPKERKKYNIINEMKKRENVFIENVLHKHSLQNFKNSLSEENNICNEYFRDAVSY